MTVNPNRTSQEWLSISQATLVPSYRPLPLVVSHGRGAKLWDVEGREFIDFTAGVAVASLGYGDAQLAQVIADQAQKVIHVSNQFLNIPALELAERLTRLTFADQVFFCNSGAEAAESLIKLARRYFFLQNQPRYEIICATKSFHGRTMATISCSGQVKYQEGFEPLLPGFKAVPFGDLGAIEKTIGEHTAAIILEPVLGEGGVQYPPRDYLKQVEALCRKKGVLFLLDEVQTAIGRMGYLFAHEHFGVTPDAMALAKGLGGGMPIGAMLTTEKLGIGLGFPSHGSTFGGNPVACAAACHVLDRVNDPMFLQSVRDLGQYVEGRLNAWVTRFPELIKSVRGMGLYFGVQFGFDPSAFRLEAFNQGLLINFCGDNVLRFAPPLVIDKTVLDEGLALLEDLLLQYSKKG